MSIYKDNSKNHQMIQIHQPYLNPTNQNQQKIVNHEYTYEIELDYKQSKDCKNAKRKICFFLIFLILCTGISIILYFALFNHQSKNQQSSNFPNYNHPNHQDDQNQSDKREQDFGFIQIQSQNQNKRLFSSDCKNFLPYDINTLREKQYLSWYAKTGTNVNGTKYEPGHFIQRHIGLGQECTDYQIANNKTIFFNYQQMLKTLRLDGVMCDFTQSQKFIYDAHKIIAQPINYIKGIDCKANPNEIRYFSKYFIQYKKTVKNSAPTNTEYLNSQKITIYTFYPER